MCCTVPPGTGPAGERFREYCPPQTQPCFVELFNFQNDFTCTFPSSDLSLLKALFLYTLRIYSDAIKGVYTLTTSSLAAFRKYLYRFSQIVKVLADTSNIHISCIDHNIRTLLFCNCNQFYQSVQSVCLAHCSAAGCRRQQLMQLVKYNNFDGCRLCNPVVVCDPYKNEAQPCNFRSNFLTVPKFGRPQREGKVQ